MSQQKPELNPSKEFLEGLYRKYNRRSYVSPDPLQFLYYYDNTADREVAGFIASCLAYGQVAQILSSISTILKPLSPSPCTFIKNISLKRLEKIFMKFKHRFTTGRDISRLLYGTAETIKQHGSLHSCFTSGLDTMDTSLLPAITAFSEKIRAAAGEVGGNLLPFPEKGSACKRLNLFLRWMVRKDDVDPGGWNDISPALLIIPLDTHMFKIGQGFGFTIRKQPDMKSAVEITNGFKLFCPTDPTRYDFVLTRFGIRKELDINSIIEHP